MHRLNSSIQVYHRSSTALGILERSYFDGKYNRWQISKEKKPVPSPVNPETTTLSAQEPKKVSHQQYNIQAPPPIHHIHHLKQQLAHHITTATNIKTSTTHTSNNNNHLEKLSSSPSSIDAKTEDGCDFYLQ